MTTESPPFDTSEATTTTSTALVATNGNGKTTLPLSVYAKMKDPLNAVAKIGADIYGSGMFGCKNVQQGRMLALHFLTTGEVPLNWAHRHHIIGGKTGLSAEAMLADFRTRLGGDHKVLAYTPDLCAVELKRGREKNKFEVTWKEMLLEDYVYTKEANEGKVKKTLPNGEPNPAAIKDNYKTPRRRTEMMWWRVVSQGVGVMSPEVSCGLPTPDELGVNIDHDTGEISDGEEVDAEFVIVDGSVEDGKEPTSEQNAAVESESVLTEPAASVSPAATEVPAVAYKTEPSPAPEPGRGEVAAQREAEKRELLLQLKKLKEALLTQEQYNAIVAKRGVSSAKDLSSDQIIEIIDKLKAVADKRAVSSGTDVMTQWAKAALGN